MPVIPLSVLLPGDTVNTDELHIKNNKFLVGPGLINEDEDNVQAVTAGCLKHRTEGGSVLWVDNRQKRYVATKGDAVIGVVTARQMDSFRVDIGASSPASLSYLSFEGATKKNRPDVKVGDIIYGKLLVANKHMDPELVCIDSTGKASGLGVIRNGGTLLHLNIQWTRRLLSPSCGLLKLLGKSLPYEIAVGLNGTVWIKGRSLEETLVIMNLITNGEKIPESMIGKYITKAANKLVGVR